MRHCGINAATAIPPTDSNAMMKEKALVAWMSRHDMVDGSNQGYKESSVWNAEKPYGQTGQLKAMRRNIKNEFSESRINKT